MTWMEFRVRIFAAAQLVRPMDRTPLNAVLALLSKTICPWSRTLLLELANVNPVSETTVDVVNPMTVAPAALETLTTFKAYFPLEAAPAASWSVSTLPTATDEAKTLAPREPAAT